MEPKMYFDNFDDGVACLAEWKKRLFLDDWIIQLQFVAPHQFECGPNNAGETSINYINKTAKIRLNKPEYMPEDSVEKFPHEQTLVHELLHLKVPYFEDEKDPTELVHQNIRIHALIEQLARSLYMAKYGLDFSWFNRGLGGTV